MTNARLLDARRPGWAAAALPPARSQPGGWYTFTSAGAYSTADASEAPRDDRAWVEPGATGSLPAEFLKVLNAAQEELGRRWNNQHPAT